MENINPSSTVSTEHRSENDVPPALAAEFQAWETASDEALENFEKELETELGG